MPPEAPPAPQSGAPTQPATEAAPAPQAPIAFDSAAFNSAFSARAARLEKEFEQRLAAREAEWAKRFEELRGGKPAEAPKPAGDDPHEARLRAMQKQLDDERKAREAEVAERSRTEERSALMSGLNALGVTGPRAAAAVAYLHGELKSVRRAKDGRVVFAVPRDGYEDELELTKGLAEWAKSDAGKEFLPARHAGGSGESPSRPGGPGAPGSKPRPGERLLAALSGEPFTIR